jgi:hypothetical protein
LNEPAVDADHPVRHVVSASTRGAPVISEFDRLIQRLPRASASSARRRGAPHTCPRQAVHRPITQPILLGPNSCDQAKTDAWNIPSIQSNEPARQDAVVPVKDNDRLQAFSYWSFPRLDSVEFVSNFLGYRFRQLDRMACSIFSSLLNPKMHFYFCFRR